MDIPDVFHSPFQSQPLDMMTTDFYISRQQLVDDRLEWLKMANVEVLLTLNFMGKYSVQKYVVVFTFMPST